jgi:hypothetical protein
VSFCRLWSSAVVCVAAAIAAGIETQLYAAAAAVVVPAVPQLDSLLTAGTIL